MEIKEKQRTLKQNASLHKWLREVAVALTEQGIEQKYTFGIEIPWSETSLKLIFQMISDKQFNKPHTSQLSSKEITQTYETMNRWLAEMGVETVPWPSEQEQALNSLDT